MASSPYNDDLWGHHSLHDRLEARREWAKSPMGKLFRHVKMQDWACVLAKCESPIEKLMCEQFKDALGAIPNGGNYDADEVAAIAEKSPHPITIVAYAQQKISRYRVDFLLACCDKAKSVQCIIVIECDGREFHQDAFADAERDAFMRACGIYVLRFSGSDIYVGAPDLALRVDDILTFRG